MLDGTQGHGAIVVSPLQALMREQVEELNDGARRRLPLPPTSRASSANTQT